MPNTGFILGISANVAADFIDGHRNVDFANRPASDLRFPFAYRFDASKLVRALLMLN